MKLNVNSIREIKIGTNINDITVPDVLRKRIKTNLDWFNAAIGGQGFTPSCVTLFTGTPGAGKSTMMLTLANSLQGKDNVVLFNTAEESLFQVKMVAERLKLRKGFLVGSETHVPTLLKACDKIRKQNPGKNFFLIVDSIQCMDDGKYRTKDGKSTHLNSGSAIRALELITSYCKQHACNAMVIGQVNKSGKMAGSNKLKHMVDSHMHLSVETKDEDFKGMRVLETLKNRFGGAGHIIFLDLHRTGFNEVARVSA